MKGGGWFSCPFLIRINMYNPNYYTGETPVLIDEAGSGITYIGFAVPGASQTEAVWAIQKIDESSNPTSIKWSGGTLSKDYKWSERTGLTYA